MEKKGKMLKDEDISSASGGFVSNKVENNDVNFFTVTYNKNDLDEIKATKETIAYYHNEIAHKRLKELENQQSNKNLINRQYYYNNFYSY